LKALKTVQEKFKRVSEEDEEYQEETEEKPENISFDLCAENEALQKDHRTSSSTTVLSNLINTAKDRLSNSSKEFIDAVLNE
jgi:hypothetical protein